MRKMMLVAAALLTAAVTQAASVGWTLAGATGFKGDAYRVYVIGQNGATDIATITDLIDAGKFADADAKALGSGTVAANGSAIVTATTAGQPTLAGGGGPYTAFFVIYDDATPDKAEKYIVISGASTLTQNPSASAATVTFQAGNQSSYIANTDNWHATPEPCSVALLLLGAAAFGLKRKRA